MWIPNKIQYKILAKIRELIIEDGTFYCQIENELVPDYRHTLNLAKSCQEEYRIIIYKDKLYAFYVKMYGVDLIADVSIANPNCTKLIFQAVKDYSDQKCQT